MALTLTPKQKKRIKEKFDTGEWNQNTPEFILIMKNVHHENPLSFARAFLPDHFSDDPPEFHKELQELYLNHNRIAIAAPRG